MTSIKVKPFLFFVWVACLLFIFIVFVCDCYVETGSAVDGELILLLRLSALSAPLR